MKKLLFIILCLLPSEIMAASATVPFSTSFIGCSGDTEYASDGWACGTSPANLMYNSVSAGVCTSSGYQQISTAANFSGGAGGRGWRRWMCGGTSINTVSPSTGTLSVSVPMASEYWIRFYIRFQTGFDWNTYGIAAFKVVRANPIAPQNFWFDFSGVDAGRSEPMGGGGLGGGNNNIMHCVSGCGWNTVNPSGGVGSGGYRYGDNSWHSIEIHLKDQTGTGTYDGEYDFWLDGSLKFHSAAVNFCTGAPQGINRFQFFANERTPNNPSPMYVDIDDIAISATGYIGPLGSSTGTGPGAPNAPTGFRAN